MDPEFEWGRLLLAVALIAVMFIVPALVIWRDLRAEVRRFGSEALTRPIRYTLDGRSYREGFPIPGNPAYAGKDRQHDAAAGEHPAQRPDGEPSAADVRAAADGRAGPVRR